MFKAAKAGFLPYPAASGSRVSLIHVADVVGAILAALPPLQAGEMASGLTIELDDGQVGGHDWPAILTALAIAADHPVRSLRLPRPVMVPIAAGNEWLCRLRRQADVLSRAKLSELYHPDWVVTGPKMSEICRWQPGFALMNGFIDTYRWYQEHSFTA